MLWVILHRDGESVTKTLLHNRASLFVQLLSLDISLLVVNAVKALKKSAIIKLLQVILC